MPFRPRPRHFIWLLSAFLILQVYMVREIVAALLLFSAIFAAIAFVAGTVWLVQFAGVRSIAWGEAWLRSLRAAGARGALVFAVITRRSQRDSTLP